MDGKESRVTPIDPNFSSVLRGLIGVEVIRGLKAGRARGCFFLQGSRDAVVLGFATGAARGVMVSISRGWIYGGEEPWDNVGWVFRHGQQSFS